MNDCIETLKKYNEWRRGADIAQPCPREICNAIDAVIAEMTNLRRVEKAARNMVAVRGRHNSEIAMRELIEVCK